MTVERYFNELLNEKNFDYEELANLLNINYSTMKTLLYRPGNILTLNMLNKFSKALNEKQNIILYKSIADRSTSRICSDGALYHICQKYCQGFGIDIGIHLNNYSFCGSYYKKRSFNSYTLVDDWHMLEIEYWNSHFYKITPFSFSESIHNDTFISKESYVTSVLYYGIRKAESIASVNVVNYSIICDNDEIYNELHAFLPKKSAIKINIIKNEVPNKLRFDHYVETDDVDFTYLFSLNRFAIKSKLLSDPESIPMDLWICGLKTVLLLKDYLNYDYAFTKIVEEDYYSFLTEEERMSLSQKSRFILYVERKIKRLNGEVSQNYKLNRYFYNITGVIASTVSFGHLNLGIFKSLLSELKPYIDFYEQYYKEKLEFPILY